MKSFEDLDDNQFLITLWSIVATAILLFTIIVGYYSNLENERMERLINKGYDPIEVRCMLKGDPKTLCQAYLQSKQETKRVKKHVKLLGQPKSN